MKNLQLLLTGGQSVATDLTVFISESDGGLFVYLGTALLERVSNDPGSLAYKMLIGRLANAGFPATHLSRTFGHDVRTIGKWAEGLLSDSAEAMVRAFAGRGPVSKLTAPLIRFVKARYLLLRDVVGDYRQRIMREVLACFEEELSRETLRKLFAEARRKLPKAAFAPAGDGAAVSAGPVELRPCEEAGERVSAPPVHPERPAGEPVGTCRHEGSADASPDESSGFSRPLDPCAVSIGCQASSSQGVDGTGHDNHSTLSPAQTDLDAPPASAASERADSPGHGGERPRECQWGVPGSGAVLPEGARLVHHAGQILFSACQDAITAFRPGAVGFQTQWIGQILQGAVNIEQSRLVCAPSLSLFTGPVHPSPDEQRTALGAMADVDSVMDAYAANARLLADGPGRGRVFLYDPHSKECTTALHKLLKGWCAGRHRIAKLMHMDFIHTESGRPCFIQHYDNFYDLRERFFITLELFGRLFPRGSAVGLTFVIDRGIYSEEMFTRFTLHGCSLITWEKGYARDGWNPNEPAVVFQAFRTGNTDDDRREYTFECQESRWEKDPSVRRIIVRATNPSGRTIEVSILCSDHSRSVERIVKLMFNRWVQENDFKYGDRHFGWMQITSYATGTYSEIADQLSDRDVECPEYRKLKRELAEREAELGKELLKRERASKKLAGKRAERDRLKQRIECEDHGESDSPGRTAGKQPSERLDEHRRELRRLNSSIGQLARGLKERATQIKELNETIEQLAEQRNDAIRKRSRLELLIELRYERPDMRRKAMMDALRVTASNMFRQLLEPFRGIWGNHRNDHVMLRMLTRCDGYIGSRDGFVEISLWLKGRYQPHRIRAFGSFLAGMQTFINGHFTGRADPVRLRIFGSAADLLSALPMHGVPLVGGACVEQ